MHQLASLFFLVSLVLYFVKKYKYPTATKLIMWHKIFGVLCGFALTIAFISMIVKGEGFIEYGILSSITLGIIGTGFFLNKGIIVRIWHRELTIVFAVVLICIIVF